MALLTAAYYGSKPPNDGGTNWILVQSDSSMQYKHAVSNMATLTFHPAYCRVIETSVYEARFLSQSEAETLESACQTKAASMTGDNTMSFGKRRESDCGAYTVTVTLISTGDWHAVTPETNA